MNDFIRFSFSRGLWNVPFVTSVVSYFLCFCIVTICGKLHKKLQSCFFSLFHDHYSIL